MRLSTIAAVTALLTVTAADAQNVRGPVSTDPGVPTAPPKPARAKKPSTVPPSIVTLANASTHTAVMVIITTEDAIALNLEALGPEGESHPQAAEASGLHRLRHSELRRWGSSRCWRVRHLQG